MWWMVMVINSLMKKLLSQNVGREQETDHVGFPLLHTVVNCEAVFCLCSVVFCVWSLGEHPWWRRHTSAELSRWTVKFTTLWSGRETCRCPCFTSFSTSMSVFLTLSALQMFQQSHMPLSLASPLSSSKLHKTWEHGSFPSHLRQSSHEVVLWTI